MGLWHLSIESINNSNKENIIAGCSNTSINVKPSKLFISLLEPSLNNYKLGDNIELKINLTYSNNTYVKNAIVTVDIFNKKIELINQYDGRYSINYTVTDDNIGRWVIAISASD